MTILHGLILGIVEGITEFLPISSTFHLITVSRLLRLAPSEFLSSFEVVIQAGAILALVTIYLRSLLTNRSLLTLVLISFLPTSIIGVAIYSIIKGYFFTTTWLTLLVFVLVGIIFFIVERLVDTKHLSLSRNLTSLTPKQAVVIGLAQATAVIPGVSRAGSVIVAMMLLGYRRDEATRYTFLLSLPTILAASTLDLFHNYALLTELDKWPILVLGFITAFIVAYLVVQWLLHYLSNHTLRLFAWYRLGIATLILLTLGL